MRNLLQRVRRSTRTDDSAGTRDDSGPPDPSVPPPGAPLATSADVITRGDLRVTFRTAPGLLALRTDQHADLIPLPAEMRSEHHDRITAWVDLLEVPALPTDEDWTYDVVLVDEGSAHHLWLPPSKIPTMATPVGGRQFRVSRGPAGFLKLQHLSLAPAVELRGFTGGDQTIDVHLPPDAEGDLLLVADDDVVATFPLRREGDETLATLSLEPIPLDEFEVATVGVGTPESWVPVRRPANGVAHPRHAVMLPELLAEDPALADVRLHYVWDATLVARVVAPSGAVERADADAVTAAHPHRESE